MKKVAIIGGGISGLSMAHCLKDRYQVTVFETTSQPGGLIKCKRVNGNLYHMVGGHVFNSRRDDVLDWFWQFFNREQEFVKTNRNSSIFLGKPIGYPIENHIYEMEGDLQMKIIGDLVSIIKNGYREPANFEEFLKFRFGNTLYELYFKPYNEKIWKRNLSDVPLDWLEGKLPMPTVEEIIYNNFRKEKEMKMVHSSFYYPKTNGSQFLADRLAKGLNMVYDTEIKSISKEKAGWIVNGELFDLIIFSGNIKDLPDMLADVSFPDNLKKRIAGLEYHGTTSVLCKIDKNPYSWIYMPDSRHLSHRIICTGNFAASNNSEGITSVTIEFTDYIEQDAILENLSRIPYAPEYITHQYTQYTYPLQTADTRKIINGMKDILEQQGIYLLGRFAEWEYYNMDAAMGAAIDLNKRIR
ncbi:MAG: NAD(P)-binding protein [Bacteroidales bacterium]|jgi:protoporphyrinogen oxidase|nr:NAD(P)-binding protein [Bacteroidales bacterium]